MAQEEFLRHRRRAGESTDLEAAQVGQHLAEVLGVDLTLHERTAARKCGDLRVEDPGSRREPVR
jgi:hypothetical protein